MIKSLIFGERCLPKAVSEKVAQMINEPAPDGTRLAKDVFQAGHRAVSIAHRPQGAVITSQNHQTKTSLVVRLTKHIFPGINFERKPNGGLSVKFVPIYQIADEGAVAKKCGYLGRNVVTRINLDTTKDRLLNILSQVTLPNK